MRALTNKEHFEVLSTLNDYKCVIEIQLKSVKEDLDDDDIIVKFYENNLKKCLERIELLEGLI